MSNQKPQKGSLRRRKQPNISGLVGEILEEKEKKKENSSGEEKDTLQDKIIAKIYDRKGRNNKEGKSSLKGSFEDETLLSGRFLQDWKESLDPLDFID